MPKEYYHVNAFDPPGLQELNRILNAIASRVNYLSADGDDVSCAGKKFTNLDQAEDTTDALRWDQALLLLSVTNVSLAVDGDTDLYTVPSSNFCLLSHGFLVAGADAGTSDLSIGQDGAETDFVGVTNLDNVDAQYDACILMPVPSATPATLKVYPPGTVIQAQVANHNGGALNDLYLFGVLFS